jgi:hypothetical protein
MSCRVIGAFKRTASIASHVARVWLCLRMLAKRGHGTQGGKNQNIRVDAAWFAAMSILCVSAGCILQSLSLFVATLFLLLPWSYFLDALVSIILGIFLFPSVFSFPRKKSAKQLEIH